MKRRAILGVVVACGAALVGAGLAWDAHVGGSLLRYRLFAYLLGGVCSVPLLSLLVLRGRAFRWWRRALFVAVPLGGALVVAELVVRLVVPSGAGEMELCPDPRLGHVAVASRGGMDARGFRNARALERATTVFIGDSQTFGFGVTREQAFASRFGAVRGEPVYQMANGSYGPVQYVELVRRALRLAPERLVVLLYFGNDLVDAADYTGLEGAETLRLDGVEPRVRPFRFEPDPAPNVAMALYDGVVASSRLLQLAAQPLRLLLRGSVLDRQAGAVRCERPDAETILLPDYRMPAIDVDDTFVARGLDVTGRALREMAQLCRDADVDLLLLTMPTKELCYAELLGDDAAEAAALDELRRREQAAREVVHGHAAAAGVRTLDLLPMLVAATRAGRRPWFASGDGHLAAGGHAVVAEALLHAVGEPR